MISDVLTLSSLVQQAPALAVAILALMFAAWTNRQARRALAESEARASLSAVRQGKRLGAVEKIVALLDMRRRITEEELDDRGIRLSPWPPDGPRPPRDDDDADDVDTSFLETQHFIPPRPTPSRRTS